jgi:putative oxidoreductase
VKITARYFSLEQRKDEVFLVARALLMILFVYLGWQKLTGFSGTVAYMTSAGAPAPTLSAIIAVVMEFAVGIAIVVASTHVHSRCCLRPIHSAQH